MWKITKKNRKYEDGRVDFEGNGIICCLYIKYNSITTEFICIYKEEKIYAINIIINGKKTENIFKTRFGCLVHLIFRTTKDGLSTYIYTSPLIYIHKLILFFHFPFYFFFTKKKKHIHYSNMVNLLDVFQKKIYNRCNYVTYIYVIIFAHVSFRLLY